MKPLSTDDLKDKLHPELPQEFKETAKKVLQENSRHNAESIIEKITSRRKNLTEKYTAVANEINRLKAINLALHIESRELSENGHTHVNSPRMREMFVTQMNNLCSIGMEGIFSIETLECELQVVNSEIEYIDSQLASLITLSEQTEPLNTNQSLIDDLVKEFGTSTPTLEQVAARYLHIQKKTALKKFNQGTLPFPAFKADEGRKAPVLVNLKDLAEYLNRQKVR